MAEIDYDALDRFAVYHAKWREMYAADLSTVYVPGEGDTPLAFVFGEAPGAQEEIRRRPFVGPAGDVLRQLMGTAGLSTEAQQARIVGPKHTAYVTGKAAGGYLPNCWLTNVVKFRPPRNRKPYWIEIQTVRGLIRAEWKAVGRPRVIIPVGKTALQALTGKPHVSILKHSGWLHEEASRVDGEPLYVWPMIHPSYGLRNPALQPLLEADWRKLGEWLATHS